MANVLLEVMARGGRAVREARLAAFARDIGIPVVTAREAEVGTVGLLVYPWEEWERFRSEATDIEGPPHGGIALIGFEESHNPGDVIVVPDLLMGDPVVALWEVSPRGRLDVVASSYGDSGFQPATAAVAALLHRPNLHRLAADDGCSRQLHPLSCVRAGCPHVCRLRRWFDPKLNRPKYACVCTRQRERGA